MKNYVRVNAVCSYMFKPAYVTAAGGRPSPVFTHPTSLPVIDQISIGVFEVFKIYHRGIDYYSFRFLKGIQRGGPT